MIVRTIRYRSVDAASRGSPFFRSGRLVGFTFNGIAATFKEVSASEIAARVPAGATTGTVDVTTAQGTLKIPKIFVAKS